MVAFAGNSVICRLALHDGAIDPAAFTSVRLVSGAVTLLLIVASRSGLHEATSAGNWQTAAALIVYAIFFSFAYVSLSAASGALILFGFVQATMIVAALIAGERPTRGEIFGWTAAAGGLIWLLLPGVDAPPLAGAAMMAVAGVGWGLYSLNGRSELRPLVSTTGNFIRVLPAVAVLAAVTATQFDATLSGLLLACLSGCLTTGIGYVIWYAALAGLTALQAALVQLSVPAIAAVGGLLFVGEAISLRLAVCGLLILGGISLALSGRSYSRDTQATE